MNLCRACLCTDKELFPSDDNFVCSYNLLTNINVKFSDGKPDRFCQSCMEEVNNFIEFRNRCVAAESTLLGIINQVVKAEVVVETEKIKVEVKHEEADYDSDEYLNDDRHEYSDDDNVIIKMEECVENEPRRYKKKTKTCMKEEEETIPSVGDDYVKLTSNKPICGLCAKEFKNAMSLNKHLTSHEVSNGCQLCTVDQFPDWPRLLAHRLLHTVHHRKCHLCGVKFRSHNNLEFHYRKTHFGDQKATLECNVCSKKFDTPRRLNKHIWGSHRGIKYNCEVCSKTFNNKQNLKTHMKVHGDVKPYACDLCDYRSKFHGGLVAHITRRHAPNKIMCKVCGVMFADAERLARHSCADKSRICPVCGKTLHRAFSRHMATHSSEARYKCDICSTAYRSRGALKVHKDKHDNNPTQQCQYCLRRFYSPSVLIKHRRVHTGEKPYACNKCDMRFTAGHNLKVHMKVHGEMLVVKKTQTHEETV